MSKLKNALKTPKQIANYLEFVSEQLTHEKWDMERELYSIRTMWTDEEVVNRVNELKNAQVYLWFRYLITQQSIQRVYKLTEDGNSDYTIHELWKHLSCSEVEKVLIRRHFTKTFNGTIVPPEQVKYMHDTEDEAIIHEIKKSFDRQHGVERVESMQQLENKITNFNKIHRTSALSRWRNQMSAHNLIDTGLDTETRNYIFTKPGLAEFALNDLEKILIELIEICDLFVHVITNKGLASAYDEKNVPLYFNLRRFLGS